MSVSKICFLQINLHRSAEAAAVLQQRMTQERVDVALNLPREHLFYDNTVDRSRAVVLVRDAAASLIREYCRRELVAVKLGVNQGDGKILVVASAYMPYDSPEPPPSEDIAGLVEYCGTRDWNLIIGCEPTRTALCRRALTSITEDRPY